MQMLFKINNLAVLHTDSLIYLAKMPYFQNENENFYCEHFIAKTKIDMPYAL